MNRRTVVKAGLLTPLLYALPALGLDDKTPVYLALRLANDTPGVGRRGEVVKVVSNPSHLDEDDSHEAERVVDRVLREWGLPIREVRVRSWGMGDYQGLAVSMSKGDEQRHVATQVKATRTHAIKRCLVVLLKDLANDHHLPWETAVRGMKHVWSINPSEARWPWGD